MFPCNMVKKVLELPKNVPEKSKNVLEMLTLSECRAKMLKLFSGSIYPIRYMSFIGFGCQIRHVINKFSLNIGAVLC